MADTEFGTNSAQNVQTWSPETVREVLKRTQYMKYTGKGEDAFIQRFTDKEKTAGDTVKYDILMQMSGAGTRGDARAKDRAEALTYYPDSFKIDQLRHVHEFKRMSQQRTLHNLRTAAKGNLSDWMAGQIDDIGIRNLCGDTTQDFSNAGVAPDTDHYLTCGNVTRSGVIATDEASLGSDDQMDMMDFDYAIERAETISPVVRPGKVDGEDHYLAIIHPYSLTDLQTNANSSATIKWSDIMYYAAMRGKDNPMFRGFGAKGLYKNVIIVSSTRIYTPRANVRRNLFLGAQAGVFAIGNAYPESDREKYGPYNFVNWFEEMDDGGNEKRIYVGMIWGTKACRFNSKNNGAMIWTCYATAKG
jgi:N4-gp56 family major capsid protein